MVKTDNASIIDYFEAINDKRRQGSVKYSLNEILLVVISAVISNAETWKEIEDWGEARIEWLRKFLPYEHGCPSADTIARVMSLINPKEFERSFADWTQAVFEICTKQVVAIDGKALRGAKKSKSQRKCVTLVSAWATENSVILGQVRVKGKSNEIEALPRLFALLTLKDMHVTLDAMGCQKKVVRLLTEQGADYTISLKGNQKSLSEEVREVFKECDDIGFQSIDTSTLETNEKGHGRIEKRVYRLLDANDWIEDTSVWSGLNSIGQVTSYRTIKGKTSSESRYYISSLEFTEIDQFALASRSHWKIENNCHWCLDVGFREDMSRIRIETAVENLAIVRRLSLQMLKADKSDKRSLRRKRRLASMDTSFLERVIIGSSLK